MAGLDAALIPTYLCARGLHLLRPELLSPAYAFALSRHTQRCQYLYRQWFARFFTRPVLYAERDAEMPPSARVRSTPVYHCTDVPVRMRDSPPDHGLHTPGPAG